MTIISTQYASGIVAATEKAAIASSMLIGLGDEKAADQKAVDAMRTALNQIDFKGRIVIGEGERDEAPMLYIGEEVGTGRNHEVDIALDLLSAKLNTEKEILKRELNFQTEEEFEQVGETSLNSVSIFQDIVTSNIVQNNFEISENEKEILSLSSEYSELISTLKNDKNKRIIMGT